MREWHVVVVVPRRVDRGSVSVTVRVAVTDLLAPREAADVNVA